MPSMRTASANLAVEAKFSYRVSVRGRETLPDAVIISSYQGCMVSNRDVMRDRSRYMQIPEIKKIYARYSRIYDAIFSRWFSPRQRQVIRNLDLKPGQRVLDVGVGTGISLPLYPEYVRVTGVDLSREMLREAQKKTISHRLDHVELLEMDAGYLAFPDRTFDVVIAAFVITVVPDPIRFLAEVHRVSKANGQIVMINHFQSENQFMARLEKWVAPLCTKIGWHSDLALDYLVQQANLHIERMHSFGKVDLWKVVYASNKSSHE
jgi:phosphatidylethanolamine/phosphatidyl-N-methylethanolamine N-methyltransferase